MELMQKPTENIKTKESTAPEAMEVTGVKPIGVEQLKKFTQTLEKYKSGKAMTDRRIVASENWWKLRNTVEEQKVSNIGTDGGFTSVSGWLHNVIVSKHADAMEAYPEPNILPREESDQGEARKLSAIVPCVLEQNQFEATYANAMWQKLKTGTGVYKVVWDKSKLNGLGDISVERVNLLNIFWEPGVTDIQRSRYFFHVELFDKDVLEQQYPHLAGNLKGKSVVNTKFLYDDHVDTENKYPVIEVYYHKFVGSKKTLQYCKYVNDQLLYATENDTKPGFDEILMRRKPSMAESGLYDHGKYPYVFDALFPIEGSPCGYGYIDLCRNPQTVIDLLKTCFVKNAMVGAVPRYFRRQDGGVNAEQFLDLSNPLVEVNGNLNDDALRRIEHIALDGNYISVMDHTIQELRETSGNTETSTGTSSSGVTAASAIAALQEASGKGSKDSTKAAYRSYTQIVDLVIELIRQFYNLPRQFRIVGQYGMQKFETYTNAGIVPQHQGHNFGQDMGYRIPVFDIKVSAQKKNVYTKVSQNELALQFFQLGFFNPQMTDQSLLCLEVMDFEGKDDIMQKVANMGTTYQKLLQYMQLALAMAKQIDPKAAEQIGMDIVQTMGGGAVPRGGATAQLMESDNISGLDKKEHGIVENARSRSNAASQPDAGSVTAKEDKK